MQKLIIMKIHCQLMGVKFTYIGMFPSFPKIRIFNKVDTDRKLLISTRDIIMNQYMFN